MAGCTPRKLHEPLTEFGSERQNTPNQQNRMSFSGRTHLGLELCELRNAFSYIFYDQFRIIVSQMTTSVALCLVAVTIISTFVLAHPTLVLSVVLALTLVFIDLLGNIVLWDLDLNTISMINLVMAIGLVVDSQMHSAPIQRLLVSHQIWATCSSSMMGGGSQGQAVFSI